MYGYANHRLRTPAVDNVTQLKHCSLVNCNNVTAHYSIAPHQPKYAPVLSRLVKLCDSLQIPKTVQHILPNVAECRETKHPGKRKKIIQNPSLLLKHGYFNTIMLRTGKYWELMASALKYNTILFLHAHCWSSLPELTSCSFDNNMG